MSVIAKLEKTGVLKLGALNSRDTKLTDSSNLLAHCQFDGGQRVKPIFQANRWSIPEDAIASTHPDYPDLFKLGTPAHPYGYEVSIPEVVGVRFLAIEFDVVRESTVSGMYLGFLSGSLNIYHPSGNEIGLNAWGGQYWGAYVQSPYKTRVTYIIDTYELYNSRIFVNGVEQSMRGAPITGKRTLGAPVILGNGQTGSTQYLQKNYWGNLNIYKINAESIGEAAILFNNKGMYVGQPIVNKLDTEGGQASQDWAKWNHYNSGYWQAGNTQYDHPTEGKVFKGTASSNTYIYDYYPYTFYAGRTYLFRFRMKSDTDTSKGFGFYLNNSVGGQHNIATYNKTYTFKAGEWQDLYALMTPSEDAIGTGGIGMAMGNNAGIVYEISQPMLVEAYATGLPWVASQNLNFGEWKFKPLAEDGFFSDDFTDNQSSKWTAVGSSYTWTHDTLNEYLHIQGTGAGEFYINNFEMQNGRILVDLSDCADGGIITRYQDENNFYMLAIRDNTTLSNTRQIELYKRLSSTYQILKSSVVDIPRGTRVAVELEIVGNDFTAYVNGSSVLTHYDASIPGRGKVGYRNYRSTTSWPTAKVHRFTATKKNSLPRAEFRRSSVAGLNGKIIGPMQPRMDHKGLHGNPEGANLIDPSLVRASIGNNNTWNGTLSNGTFTTIFANEVWEYERTAISSAGDGIVLEAPVSASTTYTFSVQDLVWTGATGWRRAVYVRYYDASNNIINPETTNYYLYSEVFDVNTWQTDGPHSTTFTTPVGAVKVMMFLGVGGTSAPAGLKVRVVRPMIEPSTWATAWQPLGTTKGADEFKIPTSILSNEATGTIEFDWTPTQPIGSIIDQGTSPRLLQIGNYYQNSSLTIWGYYSSANPGTEPALRIYVKGQTNSGWSISGNTISTYGTGWYNLNQTMRIAVKWTSGSNIYVFVNGTKYGPYNIADPITSFAGGYIYPGTMFNGSSTGNGYVKNLRISNTALSDEELIANGTPEVPHGWTKGVTTMLLPLTGGSNPFQQADPTLYTHTIHSKQTHILDSEPKHMAIVRDGGTFTYYENGVPVTTHKNRWRIYKYRRDSVSYVFDAANNIQEVSLADATDMTNRYSQYNNDKCGFYWRTFVFADADVRVWHRYAMDNGGRIRVNNRDIQNMGGWNTATNPDVYIDLKQGWNVVEIWGMDGDVGGTCGTLVSHTQGKNEDRTVSLWNTPSIKLSEHPNVLYMSSEMPVDYLNQADGAGYTHGVNSYISNLTIWDKALTQAEVTKLTGSKFTVTQSGIIGDVVEAENLWVKAHDLTDTSWGGNGTVTLGTDDGWYHQMTITNTTMTYKSNSVSGLEVGAIYIFEGEFWRSAGSTPTYATVSIEGSPGVAEYQKNTMWMNIPEETWTHCRNACTSDGAANFLIYPTHQVAGSGTFKWRNVRVYKLPTKAMSVGDNIVNLSEIVETEL